MIPRKHHRWPARAGALALGFAIAGAVHQPAAIAQDSQWIRQVDITGGSGRGEVVIRFACPMRYLSHFPLRAGDELRIALAPLPGCPDGIKDARESMPANGVNAARLLETSLDGESGVNPILSLRFAKLLEYQVQPDADFGGIRIILPSVGAIPVRTLGSAANIGTQPGSGLASSPVPTAGATGGATGSRAPTRTLPSPEVLGTQLREARAAFDTKDHVAAIRLYTRLVEYPEYPQRREAQELLGLARERNGQLAHAKAEYEEYLRTYPQGEQAARVQQRLAALSTLDRNTGGAVRTAANSRWDFFGGVSQEYRRDNASLTSGDVTNDFVALNSLRSDLDFQARRRGDRYDFTARVNGGYLKDLLPEEDGPGSDARVSYAFVELTDRQWQVTGRLGRQSRHTGGVLGSFDGLYAGWRITPKLRLNVVAGLPIERSSEGSSTDRQFAGMSLDIGTKGGRWDYSVYALQQQYEGFVDRQAIGGEVRYFRNGTSIVGLVDYDIHYNAINSVMLLGTAQVGDRWTFTGTLDHRKSPFLTTRNSLIGQQFTSLSALVDSVGVATAEQWAADRTGESDTIAVGVSRPLGERFQWTVDLTASRFSDLAASGGIEAIPGTGLDKSLSAQLLANSLFMSGDSSILGLRVYQGDQSKGESLFVSSRFPVWNGLRAGPRLRVDRRSFAIDGGTQNVFSPSLRLDWRGRRTTVEFEAGGEWADRKSPLLLDSQDKRWWVSLGYRLDF